MIRIHFIRGTTVCVVASSIAMTQALGQSFSTTVLTTSPISNDTKTDWSGSLSFPKFNVRGATLDSVTFTFSETLSTTFNLDNYANGGRSKAIVDVSTALNSSDPNFSGTGSLPSASINFTTPIVPKGGSISTSQSTTESATLTFTTPSILSQWIGAGSLVVPIETQSDFGVTVYGGNNQWSLETTAGATGSVTYNYHKGPQPNGAVPEPSTYALTAGIGLWGFGMARRLSNRQVGS